MRKIRTISEVRVGDPSEGASWWVKKLDQRLNDMKKVDDANTLGVSYIMLDVLESAKMRIWTQPPCKV